MARNSMSENLQQRIDESVKQISVEGYKVRRRLRRSRMFLRRSQEDGVQCY